jgi:hypothetical protein
MSRKISLIVFALGLVPCRIQDQTTRKGYKYQIRDTVAGIDRRYMKTAQFELLDQAALAWLNSPVCDGGSMGTSNVTICWIVLVKPRKDLGCTWSVAPVTHEVANDGKHADHLYTSRLHALVGGITNKSSCGTGSLDISPDTIASSTKREGQESSAYSS